MSPKKNDESRNNANDRKGFKDRVLASFTARGLIEIIKHFLED